MTLKGVTCYTCGKRDAIETDADSATVVAHFERRGWQVGNTRPESTLRTRCPDCKRDGLLRPDEAADRYGERLNALAKAADRYRERLNALAIAMTSREYHAN